MKTKLIKVLLVGLGLTWWFCPVRAQLAVTNTEGIRIDAQRIYRWGDARNLDCTVSLKLSGRPLLNVWRISPLRLLRAVDDTGKELAKTNRPLTSWTSSPIQKFSTEYFSSVEMKAPDPLATVITDFEAEADVVSPTEDPPVFTNFLAQAGKELTNSELTRYQVKLAFLEAKTKTNGPIRETELKLQAGDPKSKLSSLIFETAEGTVLQPKRTSSIQLAPETTTMVYTFIGKLPDDLRLVASLAVPEKSHTLRIKLENIHLPWVEWLGLQVTATDITREESRQTNARAYRMLLTFMGGPSAQCSGIGNLSLSRAIGDAGQDFKINEKSFWLHKSLSPSSETSGLGRNVQKWVPLITSSPDAKCIRLLEGEVELFNPSLDNGGIVEFENYIAHPGEPLSNDALSRCGVNLAFLGLVNYERKDKEWKKQRVLMNSGKPPHQASETVNDSVMFSIRDPEGQIVKMEFFDDQGITYPNAILVSSKTLSVSDEQLRVYNFDQLPKSNWWMRIRLKTPESLQRLKFKVENIPLPP